MSNISRSLPSIRHSWVSPQVEGDPANSRAHRRRGVATTKLKRTRDRLSTREESRRHRVGPAARAAERMHVNGPGRPALVGWSHEREPSHAVLAVSPAEGRSSPRPCRNRGPCFGNDASSARGDQDGHGGSPPGTARRVRIPWWDRTVVPSSRRNRSGVGAVHSRRFGNLFAGAGIGHTVDPAGPIPSGPRVHRVRNECDLCGDATSKLPSGIRDRTSAAATGDARVWSECRPRRADRLS